MGHNISMTCCSSEEIVAEADKPNLPTIYAYPEACDKYNLPRSNSELTKLALEDNSYIFNNICGYRSLLKKGLQEMIT